MLENYPYNEEFEAWEMTLPIFDADVKVLTQAADELEFLKRTVELRQRIEWLNTKDQEICELLSSKDLTVDGDARFELRPAEIAVVKCYAEMVPEGIALDLIIAIVATGIEKEVSMFVDEFDNMVVIGEYREDEEVDKNEDEDDFE